MNCVLRYINYVELMCPIFRVESLFKVLDTFAINRSGWGIDWIWAERLKGKRIAVIDEASVIHEKAVGSGVLYKKLGEMHVSAYDEMAAVLKAHGLVVHHEEYGRVFKPWAKKIGIFGKSKISEKVLRVLQYLYYRLQGK